MEGGAMSSVLASVSSRKEKAAKALASLHSHRNLITSCIKDWEELERSFGITERALQQKFKELVDREKEFDNKMQEARAVLDKREESIAGLEETSVVRVKEQKDTAVAAIAEERSMFEEKRIKWKSEMQAAAQVTTGGSTQDKEGGGTQSKGESQDDMKILNKVASNPNPAVKAQQKGPTQNLDRFSASKESKDVPKSTELTKHSTLAAQNEKKKADEDKEPAKKTRQHVKDQGVKDEQKKEDQLEVSKNKRKDSTPVDEAVAKRQKGTSVLDVKAAEGQSNGAISLEEAIKAATLAAETPTSVQIKAYVDKMDWEGLRDFLANRKDSKKLRPELLAALQASSDPCVLLLKVLEGSEDTSRVVLNNKTGQSCILLLECLSEVVADPVLGADYPVVPSELKEMARIIARRWKSKLELHNQDGQAVGSHLFLQLLASFGIGTDYSDEDMLNFVVAMSHRARGPALCRSLGLTDRIPVVVDRLVKGGKQIDAITFASAFNLSDRFDTATLLKCYLEDSRRESDIDKVGSKRSGQLTKQITALKNAVKVIEEHNLDSQFPLEELRVRISVLSQERAEKKANINSKEVDKSDKGLQEFESGRPNIAPNSDHEVGVQKGGSGEGKHGIYGTAPYATGDSVRSIRGDYVPTDIGRPLFPPHNVDSHYRHERQPESSYDGYDVGRNRPMSLSNPYVYASRDGIGAFASGIGSSLPTIHSYSGMSRDELSDSRGRAYPEIPRSGSSYQLGSGLVPRSSSFLPYYLR